MKENESNKKESAPSQSELKNLLCDTGLVFKRTTLGEPFFCKAEAEDADQGNAISFRDWNPDQLEAIAKTMREYPSLRRFPDGSGA